MCRFSISSLFAISLWAGALRASPCTLLLSGPKSTLYAEIEGRILEQIPEDTRVVRAGRAVWVQDWFPHLLEDERGWVAVFPRQGSHARVDRRVVRTSLERHGARVSPDEMSIVGGNFVRLGNLVVTVGRRDDGAADRELAPFGLAALVIPTVPLEITGHADLSVADAGPGVVVVADSRDPARKITLDWTAKLLRQRGFKVVRVMNGGFDRGAAMLSYANVIRLGDRVLVPAYAAHARRLADHWPKPVAKSWTEASEFVGALDAAQVGAWVEQVSADDGRALETWRELGFDARSVDLNEAFEFGGSLHCLTKTITGEAQLLVPDEMSARKVGAATE